MFIAAFIFVMSAAAAIQFAVSSWRSVLIRATAGSTLEAANTMNINGFQDASAYGSLCPDLGSGSGPSLRSVGIYFGLIQSLRGLGAGWTTSEMALCTRYANVVLSQRLARNQAYLAEVRSY